MVAEGMQVVPFDVEKSRLSLGERGGGSGGSGGCVAPSLGRFGKAV